MAIARRIFVLLMRIIDGPEGESERVQMGYKLGERSWLVPDVSITHPDQACGKYLEGAPLVAVEVISEANTARQIDRTRKLYLENGGSEVWVGYPETPAVLLFRGGHPKEITGEVRSGVIPELL